MTPTARVLFLVAAFCMAACIVVDALAIAKRRGLLDEVPPS